MYHIRIAGELAFDALWDGSTVVSASISQAANAAAYLDLTLAPSSGVSEGDEVTVDWDGEALFSGTVTEVSRGIDGTISASAVSGIDRLSGALVPPHSTDGSVGETCPGTRAAYVQWLVQLYNERSMGGYRVDVGENQADRLTTEPLSVSEAGWASVAQLLDDHVLSLGAHLGWEPREGGGTLSIWADLHEAADQLIDLGVNMTDIHVTRTLEGRRTAVVPRCEGESGELTLEDPSEDAAAIVANAGLMLAGGAIYDPEAVAEWGWSEEAYDVEGATSDEDLARAGVPRLRTLLGPSVTVEVRAVDAALYDPYVGHLRMGQAARVRAAAFGVDEYLAVQDVALDLMDPGQTSYTLGVAYDTLTGRQSTFLRQMNASIDHSLDLIGGVSAEVGKVAGDLVAVEGKADEALDKATDAITGLGSVTETVTDLGSEVEQARQDAADALAAADQAVQDATQGVREAKDAAQAAVEAADAASQKADAAAEKADGYQQQITDVTTKVNGVESDVAELSTSVTGAVEDASQALTAATEAKQDLSGFKTTVSQTYETKADADAAMAQEVLDRNSAIEQTAGSIRAEVSQTYQPKGDYATSGDLASYATKTEVEQTASELSQSVEAVSETAEGALTQATTAQQTANSVKTNLETNYVSKTDAAKTYSTKAELSATSSSLTASIEEAASTAEAAQEKALEVEATASGLSTTISQVSSTANTANSTANAAKTAAGKAQTTADNAVKQVTQLDATVDGISTSVTKAQQTADSAVSAASKAQQDITGFKTTVANTYQTKAGMSAYATDAEVANTYATKSSVTQTANEIKQEVSETYATQAEVDGISIGGRNLVLGTGYENLSHVTVRGGYGTASIDTADTVGSRSTLKFVTTQAGASGKRDIMHELIAELSSSRDTVVSFWVKGSVAANMMVRIGGGYTAGTSSMNKSVTTAWRLVTVDMGKLGGSGSTESYVIIAFDRAGTFRISGMKAEFGTKPTDWSPAPEDMLSTADAAATYASKSLVTQTKDQILSEVSTEYQSKDGMSSYATKSYVDQQDTSIKSTVQSVKTTADSALTKATTVEQTADGIQVTLTETTTTANSALSKANSAASAASTAQSTANTAKSTATTANNTANSAKTTANSALSRVTVKDTRNTNQNPKWYATNYPQQEVLEFKSKTAIGLSSAAGTYVYLTTYVPWDDPTNFSGGYPKQTAKVDGTGKEYWRVGTSATAWSAWQDALGTAQSAAKTATNYLKFDSAGLCVGNQTAGTLGYNALITSAAYQIRNGSTVLSSFGASAVELGKNSTSAQLKLCGGAVTMRYTSFGGLSLNKGITVDGAVMCNEANVGGVGLTVAGRTILGGKGSDIACVKQGSKVLTVSATNTAHVVLFSNSEYANLVGREYKTGDVVLVSNGDYQAHPAHVYGTVYRGDNKNWYVCIATGHAGSMRVNYVIVAVA